MSALRRFGAAFVAAAASACAPQESPPAPPPEVVVPDAPPGTVVLVDEVAISSTELERWATWIAHVEPHLVSAACRRYALTNGLLERAAVRSKFGDARKLAEQRALHAAERLRAGATPANLAGATVQAVAGGWNDLGLQLFSEARDAQPSAWTGPIERTGTFTLFRVTQTELERDHLVLSLDLVDYPYLAPDTARKDIPTAIDDAQLHVIAPDARTLVPEAWKYRMNGPAR